MSKNVTIDLRKLHDSGIGTYLRALVPRVAASLPDVSFRLLGDIRALERLDWPNSGKITLIDCGVPPLSLREQWELPRYLPHQTDLLWMTHFNIPLVYRGKLLVTIHDIFPAAMPHLATRGQSLYVSIMLRAIRAKANKILSDSEFTKNEIVRCGHLDQARIETALLGIDPSWFQIAKEENPHLKPYLLFVGNVKPNKNLAALLEAFARLQDQISHDLVIVGKKEGFRVGDQAVLARAESLGTRVVFTGFVDENTLRQYFVHAEALVFPSLYEGFGLPPLEAMACGVPVIVSHRASLPEVCGKAALYFDPENPEDIAKQILRCVQDPKRRAAMRTQGRCQAAQFDWDRCAAKTSQVIAALL